MVVISNIYINSHPIYFYNEYDNSMIDRVNTLFFKDFITFNYKIYESNISAGGLFDDWDF